MEKMDVGVLCVVAFICYVIVLQISSAVSSAFCSDIVTAIVAVQLCSCIIVIIVVQLFQCNCCRVFFADQNAVSLAIIVGA